MRPGRAPRWSSSEIVGPLWAVAVTSGGRPPPSTLTQCHPMNIIGFLLLVCAPLTLLVLLAGLYCAKQSLRGHPELGRVEWLGRMGWYVLFALSLLVALGILPLEEYPNQVHTYWAITCPLMGLFVSSGLVLAGKSDSKPNRGPWIYAGLTLALAFLPVLRFGYFSGEHSIPRGTLNLTTGLWDVFSWGFGAARPEFLKPETVVALNRGADFLPRILTVPVGVSLIFAWLWIAAGTLVLCARRFKSPQNTRAFLLMAPAILGALIAVAGTFGASVGPLEAGFFSPDRRDGIWNSDPLVIQSWGPVLLAALLMGFLVRGSERRSRG